MALCFVAMQQGPETIFLIMMGRRRGWVSYVRELRTTPLVLVSAGLGLAIDFTVRAVLGLG